MPDSSDIAKLAAWGDAQLAAGPNALISAAVQADIWMKEYGVGLAAGTDPALVNEITYINSAVPCRRWWVSSLPAPLRTSPWRKVCTGRPA